MTTKEIQEQIEVLKAATLKATSSKKAAKNFLISAGILIEPVKRNLTSTAQRNRTNAVLTDTSRLVVAGTARSSGSAQKTAFELEKETK